jgi:hypothetical protein
LISCEKLPYVGEVLAVKVQVRKVVGNEEKS